MISVLTEFNGKVMDTKFKELCIAHPTLGLLNTGPNKKKIDI